MPELWVERVATGDPQAPWAPDLPERVLAAGLSRATLIGGIPTDKVDDPEKQTPLTQYLLAVVPEDQEEYITGAVDPLLVPEADKLTVRMLHECGDEYETTAITFFASIDGLGTGSEELKELAKGLLEQARARDLSDEKAEEIRDQYDLPALASVGR